MVPIVIGIAVILIFILIFILIKKSSDSSGHATDWSSFWQQIFEAPQRRAGRIGEQRATDIISIVLREDDRLFTNVAVSYDDNRTELDNVIVNQYGVFIIEVKNYSGTIIGNEDEYDWRKFHATDAGNVYEKIVKNPIPQVKRQIYILANYLRYSGAPKVWIKGYAMLLNDNSPVESEYILSDVQDIDRAIHTPGRNRLSQEDIEEISNLLC